MEGRWRAGGGRVEGGWRAGGGRVEGGWRAGGEWVESGCIEGGWRADRGRVESGCIEGGWRAGGSWMKGETMRPRQMQEQMHRRGRNNCIDRIGRGRRRDVEHRNVFLVQASILMSGVQCFSGLDHGIVYRTKLCRSDDSCDRVTHIAGVYITQYALSHPALGFTTIVFMACDFPSNMITIKVTDNACVYDDNHTTAVISVQDTML